MTATDPSGGHASPSHLELPWATSRLGLTLRHHETRTPAGPDSADWEIPALVLPGLRRNPRRAHLLVSTVLGKHLPTDPHRVLDAGDRLADLVRARLEPGEQVAVLGFAETATGLGHTVAARLGAHCYLHSTRRDVPAAETLTGFEEGHSHATSHLLQPAPAGIFLAGLPLVLVDDEISTGATALDAIRALHRFAPRPRYLLASLVDMRTAADREAFGTAARELGVRIDTVCLATGETLLPATLIDAVAALPEPVLNPVAARRGGYTRIDLPWPQHVPEGGRHGFLGADAPAFDAAVTAATTVLRDTLAAESYTGRPVLVIAHEEFMYLPLRMAAALAESGIPARYQTTTRSPAHVLDEPGYPLRRGFRFLAPEYGEDTPRYLYNADWSEHATGIARSGTAGPAIETPVPPGTAHDRTTPDPILLLVVDDPADTDRLTGPEGLIDVLTASGADVLLAVIPATDPRTLASSRLRPEGNIPVAVLGPQHDTTAFAHAGTGFAEDAR